MVRRFPAGRYFNPRSPDGERPCPATIRPLGSRFQSTLPGWGATNQLLTNPSSQGISIHAPRMGSDRNMSRRPRSRTGISIHAPRMGSDWRPSAGSSPGSYFNPRSPDGERQATTTSRDGLSHISIHAPRMGSDVSSSILFSFHMYFNPRSPDGERLRVFQRAGRVGHGISIHAPRMGSDGDGAAMAYRADISIHAPRMGSDQQQ